MPVYMPNVPPKHKPHDLILLGQGPSMEGCPFDTETWASVSVLSHKGWEDKPYSKVFLFDFPDNKPDEKAGLAVAEARGLTIVGTQPYVCINEHYPWRAIYSRFGAGCYWNDMSYMIAYALWKGYRALLLYGVDQGPEPLYQMGRPFTTYWLGVATGMGVTWELASRCILWRHSL